MTRRRQNSPLGVSGLILLDGYPLENIAETVRLHHKFHDFVLNMPFPLFGTEIRPREVECILRFNLGEDLEGIRRDPVLSCTWWIHPGNEFLAVGIN